MEKYSELVKAFEMLETTEDKYTYLIELGKELQPLNEKMKVNSALVPGCVSKVWLHKKKTENGYCQFQADSDAMIVKGLIYVLQSFAQEKTIEQFENQKSQNILKEISLSNLISQQRANGFFHLLEKIKSNNQ